MRSFVSQCNNRLTIAWLLLAGLLCSLQSPGFASDETAAAAKTKPGQQAVPDKAAETNSDEESANGLKLEVLHVKIENLSSLDVIHGQLVVQVSITNNTATTCTLDAADFAASLNQTPCDFNPAVPEPLIVRNTEIPPGESRVGSLAFNVRFASSKEPNMVLTWNYDGTVFEADLNAEARRTTKISTSHVGPDDCLAIVEFHRTVDHLGVWLISEQLQALKRSGNERVLLSVHPKDPPPNLYSMRSSIAGWLASVQAGQNGQRGVFSKTLQAPVQFESFHVVGMATQTSQSGYYARQSPVFKTDRDRAIADSLRLAYNHVPLEDALRDLAHEEPGVQLVAIEANLDRLTEPQLQEVVRQAKNRTTDYQVLVAKNLFRVPFPSVAETLIELVQHEDKQVSEAAVESLVKSVSPNSVATLNKIWRDGKDDHVLREVIVKKVLESSDHRHSRLLTDYAISQLRRFSEPPTSANEDADEEDSDSDEAADKSEAAAEQAIAAKEEARAIARASQSLSKVLVFLQAHDNDQLLSVARETLLEIHDPVAQDVLMSYLLRSPDGADEALATAYIEQRLPPEAASDDSPDQLTKQQTKALNDRLGPRPGSHNRMMTGQVLQTIRKYPDTRYADRLLNLIESEAVTSNTATQVFRTAVRCADHQCITELTENIEEMSSDQLGFLLGHLSGMNHPSWLQTATACLQKDIRVQNIALSTLSRQGTPESIQVVVDFLEALRLKIDDADGFDSATQSLFARTLEQLKNVTYPEARRIVNRCHRSSVLKLSDMADNCIDEGTRSYFRSTPYQADFKKIFELRNAGEHEEAIKAISELLEKDPFYTSLYVSRASLYLRTDHPEPAMKDLQIAARQNPEDAVIESISAIAQVRLGNVEQGIAEAEAQFEKIPDLTTQLRRDTIYNTACVYGRASEVAPNTEVQAKYEQRAITLLQDCTNRKGGFDDLEHLLDDPDLKMLHQHPDWQAIVDKVRENEKAKPKP
ncbi:HEAT repeat domain-containing protein [Fuerstiella marisgermanici]|uniref:Uncharacterized protein n=1 Tax=Fuerstiella marisgermanici TaxID=1891926 RepID=A0A1P8WBC6_9PLAN|nr:HEAT repeat domain-containing protein [Fuerstiella marisgermanici]APZ91336.1 hypothetical protein Fuma_00924 [Fuerstiella marisgermanici]